MTGWITGYDGVKRRLPTVLEWRFEYGLGVPCDSFWVKCLWEGSDLGPLDAAVRFHADENGTRCFTGVVDEYELQLDAGGQTAELSGRGMAALLLDNEAEAADYGTATWADLVRRHVAPYGIETVGTLPPASGFSVSYGSSEWQAVYSFARYYGGVTPRFDRLGRLVVSGWEDGPVKRLDDRTPLTRLIRRRNRYGVLSQVLVRDKSRKAVETVNNSAFQALGGQCRRWHTMPGRSSYQAMRYQGQYQLAQSMAGLDQLELTAPAALFAAPGELIQLQRTGWGGNGLWRVISVQTGVRPEGAYTAMTLGRPEWVK